MSLRYRRPVARARQRGATLVIALLILVLIMMLGITAVSTSDTQFKLAGNLQFEDMALNNAETAVAVAENWLSTGNHHADAGFATYDAAKPQLSPIGRLAGLAPPDNNPITMAWSDTNSLSVGGTNQRYFIEQMSLNNRLQGSSHIVGGRASSGCNQVNTYLISGRGTSARGATKFVQSYYSVLNYSVLNCP